jgi:hypothetical protein
VAPTPPGSSLESASPGGVRVDASLLDPLPAEVDGVPLEFAPEASEQVAADAGIGRHVNAVAYAIAGLPAGDQLLVVSVSRLREGRYDEELFRVWREDYDRGACAQAGGVRQGSLVTEVDGRNVFVGSCVNGGNTYHVWLPDRSAILSAVSFGDRRLGERLVQTLEE